MDPDYSDSYTAIISKFILKSTLDERIQTIIRSIKEGLLVYEGISFSPEFGQAGKWDFELNIFLELEIIFYLAGYNGDIHKEIYGQLLDYIKEINSISNTRAGKTIRLFYTEDVRIEIDNYFTTAESIFDKHEVVDPSKKAMTYLLEDVTSKADIRIKKVQLYNFLRGKDIFEFKVDFFSEENKKYNTITKAVYEQNCNSIVSEKGDEYVQKCTDKINQIEILRKNINSSLKEAKYVLLTANGTIFKCAYAESAYEEGDAPKAVDVDYLINRFWYKLNKGFGQGEGPKSIDIISRARMVIASMTISKVSQVYDDIRRKYAEGLIDDTEVAEILSELRRESRNPEEISSDQIDDQFDFLNNYEISKKIEDIRRAELAHKKDKEMINVLKGQLEKAEEGRAKDKEEYQEENKKLEERIASLELSKAQSEVENRELNTKIQEFLEREHEKRRRKKQALRGSIFILGLAILAIIIFIACRNFLKIDDSVSGLISILLALLFQFVTPMKKLWKKFVVECDVKDE